MLQVDYVNLGQGDGTIWQLPGGGVIVYDCGIPASSSSSNAVTTRLRALGYPAGSRIHALIASHGHLDHIGGCEEVLADYAVDHVYDVWYQGSDAPQSYTNFRNQVQNEGAILHDLQDDAAIASDVQFHQFDAIPLPSMATGISAQILWPNTMAPTWDRIAEASIVIRLTYGSTDYCFQGDIETAQETQLGTIGADLNCEVFLMGHHGSRHANSAAWLAKMDPEYAPVSFGSNSYGHPTSEALCRAQTAGAAVYATHRLGTITIATDGTQITVTPNSPETIDYCAYGANYWTTSSGTNPPPPPPPPAPTGITITDIEEDPTGDDVAPNAGEYATIQNGGTTTADLTDWTLADAGGATFTFPTYTLAAGSTVRIHTGPGTNTPTDLFWGRGSSVWNNSGGDTAYLRDPSGSLVDDFTY